jgi:hypothetical protein
MTTATKPKASPTKGPLKTHGWNSHGLVITSQDGMYLGYAQGYPSSNKAVLEHQAVSEEVAVANAELWVAAPEMLEALEQLARVTRMYLAVGIKAIDVAIMAANDAIKHAKGEM